MKVVFHIHDLTMWSTCLANVNNLLEASEGDEIKNIEVVANGPAIKGYLDPDIGQKIDRLQENRGIVFSSCAKAMSNQDVAKENLLANVQVVASGVYRLVKLQQQGYLYIKV